LTQGRWLRLARWGLGHSPVGWADRLGCERRQAASSGLPGERQSNQFSFAGCAQDGFHCVDPSPDALEVRPETDWNFGQACQPRRQTARPKKSGRVLEVRLWSFMRRPLFSVTSKTALSPSSIVTEKGACLQESRAKVSLRRS